MSNLGKYQVMTTMAKKVGGPDALCAIVCGGGAVLGATVVGAIWMCTELKDVFEEAKYYNQGGTAYKVKKYGVSSDGLIFEVGDRFRVVKKYDDIVLIEIIGNLNNPHIVGDSFLKDLSNYRG